MEKLSWLFELVDRISGPAKKISNALGKVGSTWKTMQRDEKGRFLSPMSRALGTIATVFGPRAAGVVGKIGGALGALKPVASAAGSALSAVGSAFVRVGGAVLAGAGLGIAAGGQWLASSLAFRENTIGSLQAMLKSKSAAEAVFNDAVKFAAKTPFSTSQVAGAFEKLVSAGFKVNELRDVMTDLGDFAGADMEKLQRALLAMSQIRSVGKLQGDELMQLAEAGLPVGKVYDMLAKKLGKTTDEVRKLQEAGKLKAEPAIDAIRAVMKEQFGGRMEGASQTLTGLWSTLMSVPEDLLFNPATASALQPMITEVKKFLTDLIAAFGPETANGKRLIEMFKLIGDAIASVFGDANKGRTLETTIGGILNVVEPLLKASLEFGKGLFAGMGAVFKPLIDVFVMLGKQPGGIEKLTEAMSNFGKVAGFVLAAMAVGVGLLMAIGPAIMVVLNEIGKATKDFGEWLGGINWGQLAIDVVNGLITGLLAMINPLGAAMNSLAKAAIDAAKKALGIASPSTVFEELGRFTGQGFINGLLNSGIGAAIRRALDLPDKVDVPDIAKTTKAQPAQVPGGGVVDKLLGLSPLGMPFNIAGLAASVATGGPGVGQPQPGLLDRIMGALSGATGAGTTAMVAAQPTTEPIRAQGNSATLSAAQSQVAPVQNFNLTVPQIVVNVEGVQDGAQVAQQAAGSFTTQLGAALKQLGASVGR